MIVPIVDLKAQYRAIAAEVEEAIHRVVADADFILGADVELFEREFADFCEAGYAVGLDSGTSALELALRAHGVGEGDEVITVSHTFIATAAAISYTGARPVLIDIDPDTYNIDVARIEAAVTPRTKAIVPVHLYGQPPTSIRYCQSRANTTSSSLKTPVRHTARAIRGKALEHWETPSASAFIPERTSELTATRR